MEDTMKNSAMTTAIACCAVLAAAGRSPVRITADGSTYWKTRSVDFDGLVRKELAELVPDVPFEIVRIDEAPMVGAAVAAMRTLK